MIILLSSHIGTLCSYLRTLFDDISKPNMFRIFWDDNDRLVWGNYNEEMILKIIINMIVNMVFNVGDTFMDGMIENKLYMNHSCIIGSGSYIYLLLFKLYYVCTEYFLALWHPYLPPIFTTILTNNFIIIFTITWIIIFTITSPSYSPPISLRCNLSLSSQNIGGFIWIFYMFGLDISTLHSNPKS